MSNRLTAALLIGLSLAACSKKAPVTPGGGELPPSNRSNQVTEITPRDLTPTVLEGAWKTESTPDGYARKITVRGDVMKFEIFEPSGELYYAESLYISISEVQEGEVDFAAQYRIDYSDLANSSFEPEFFDIVNGVVSIGRQIDTRQDYRREL
jgi:hypothetical protein